jgi:hypothetical protein
MPVRAQYRPKVTAQITSAGLVLALGPQVCTLRTLTVCGINELARNLFHQNLPLPHRAVAFETADRLTSHVRAKPISCSFRNFKCVGPIVVGISSAREDRNYHRVLDSLRLPPSPRMTARSRHLNLRFPLHADAGLLAQPGENLVPDPGNKDGASFTLVKQLRQPIDAFIESYNPHAKPVASTKGKVHQNASNHGSPINDFGY